MESCKNNNPVGRLRKGAWTKEEDDLLRQCIEKYGERRWHLVPLRAGLNRCRKSCRLRWLNYLRPNIKRGSFNKDEVDLIVRLHKLLGNRWSLIAGRIPGRTANDVKNFWNTHVEKKMSHHKRISSSTHHQQQHAAIIIKPRPRTFSSLKPPPPPTMTATETLLLGGASQCTTTRKQEPPCLLQTSSSSSSSQQQQQQQQVLREDDESIRWWRNLLDEASSDDHHRQEAATFDSFMFPYCSGWYRGEEEAVDKMLTWHAGPCGNNDDDDGSCDMYAAGDVDARGK